MSTQDEVTMAESDQPTGRTRFPRGVVVGAVALVGLAGLAVAAVLWKAPDIEGDVRDGVEEALAGEDVAWDIEVSGRDVTLAGDVSPVEAARVAALVREVDGVREVQVELAATPSPSGTPTAPTPTPEPTAVAEPTSTPEPTATAEPTPAPTVTPTPAPTVTPTPRPTAEPTAEPTPTPLSPELLDAMRRIALAEIGYDPATGEIDAGDVERVARIASLLEEYPELAVEVVGPLAPAEAFVDLVAEGSSDAADRLTIREAPAADPPELKLVVSATSTREGS
ncbi:MAG: BON domain-containing protein [Acidimicrobiales bacterium]|nr:BON domain-containing protein [Acidimicrobiales bacterium]